MVRRLLPWWIVWGAAGALAALTTWQSLGLYHEFRSGWPWDLAYNNQWFWALVRGDQTLSIRPINSWGNEGPSIWVRTHLDPFRVLFVPIYAVWPDPRTLLVIHNIILWMVVPAAFGLVRAETGSTALALAGAALVPLTPLLWPLAWNDFREMALALPFVLWAIQGYRGRQHWLAALGIAGMLLSREEFGVMVALLALLPPRESEPIGRTYRWSRAVVALGTAWVVFAFFGYQDAVVGSNASELYLAHFGGEKASLSATTATAVEFLGVGLGSWAVLALLAPRVAVLALPWLLGISSGRWSLRFLDDWRWHHVRYTTPFVALVLAAGLVGFGRLGLWALRRRGGRWIVAGAWLATALGLLVAKAEVDARLARVERPISAAEAQAIWRWIDQVGPEDGVVAAYEVSAPLSSRRLLYSNVLEVNKPRGYPDRFGPEITWLFLRVADVPPEVLTAQGFEEVHRGDFLVIYRRDGAS